MSAHFPLVLAACEAVKQAMLDAQFAKTRIKRILANRATKEAEAQAVAAYGGEMLPLLFGGEWRLSRRNSHFPPAVVERSRYALQPHLYNHILFDHPLVYRRRGTAGPDTVKNTVIIGRPYSIVANGLLQQGAREAASRLAALGWGLWWRPDLSAWFPGWTQLVIAKGGLQAGATPPGFLPLASPDLGVSAWDEWQACPGAMREHMTEDDE